MSKVGRNDPCPCGSGKKYKQCCLLREQVRGAGKRSGVSHEALQVPQWIQTAVQHHQAGRLQEAEAIYRKILAVDPTNFHALNLLGTVAYQAGKHAQAIELIGQAILRNPSSPDAQNNLGVALHAQGRLDEAAACYRKALALKPDYADAHNNLGGALLAQGKPDEAAACCRKALELLPDFADAHSNLGNALRAQGRLDGALACFRRALTLKPDDAQIHNNLGAALQDRRVLDEAVSCYRRALALAPDIAEVHANLGSALRDQGKLAEAEACCRRALTLNPDHAKAHADLGSVLRAQGRLDEAVDCYRQAVRIDPGNAEALHMIAAMTGNTSERAPGQYVKGLFDGFADKFDGHLVQLLQYDIPAQLVALVGEFSDSVSSRRDVLDLGCGTGLVGAEIASCAAQLVGVDLSGKMLDKARARNVYTRLVESDLLSMMRGEPQASYDIVTAADVLVYLGRLDELVAEIRRVLRADGLFGFSVEALEPVSGKGSDQGDSSDYRLMQTGRYAHSSAYLAKLASGHGFRILKFEPAKIRLEKGIPVQGWIALWKS